jgi:6-phosphogluconolactonase (cycloisomerase 2 family)
MTFEFDIPGPGDVQNQPRPHHTAVDPSGSYILSVDLGADMIRVFRISLDHQITEIQGLKLDKGDFPRHVAFVSLKDRVQLYILLQDTNALLTYKVGYPESGGLTFSKEDSFPLLRAGDGSGVNHKDDIQIKASHLDVSVRPLLPLSLSMSTAYF